MTDTLEQKYYIKAVQFLRIRPRSEKEVREKLIKYKTPENYIETIIQKLTQQRFLNDEAFAKWWVEQRSRFRQKGWIIVKMELKQKGIHESILKDLETKIRSQELEGVKSELDQAKELVQKHLKKYRGLTRDEVFNKLGGMLGRRGFSYDIIKACIDELFKK